MSDFPVHTLDTASDDARTVLEKVQAKYGFLPNLFGTMAGAPALADAYFVLSDIFSKTSFTPTEQQVVLISTSVNNACTYCVAAHSVIAQGQKVPGEVVESLRNGEPLQDSKLEALRRLTVEIVESRGWPDDAVVAAFFDAGYSPQQLLEVILGVGLKTLSNYTNHIAETPLDDAFSGAAWSKSEASAAGG